jgi:DNA-binding NarL/FixJ family response regulator
LRQSVIRFGDGVGKRIIMSSAAVDVIDVFLLAENRLFREALARVIAKKSDLRVLGAAAFGDDTLEQITELQPHVLLWEPTASDPDVQLIRTLRSALPDAKLMMLGMDEDPGVFLRCVRCGVAGFLLKDASASEVAVAIRTVAYEGAICSPKLCLQLFRYFSTQPAGKFIYRSIAETGLSRREQQLLELAGQGLTNKEIANTLNLSEQTVKNHIHRVLRKLGTTDRLSAVEICRGHGLFA